MQPYPQPSTNYDSFQPVQDQVVKELKGIFSNAGYDEVTTAFLVEKIQEQIPAVFANIERLETKVNTTGVQLPFVIPHTTVPACLLGAALWAALKFHELFTKTVKFVGWENFVIGAPVGLLFGTLSLLASIVDSQSLKSTTLEEFETLKGALNVLLRELNKASQNTSSDEADSCDSNQSQGGTETRLNEFPELSELPDLKEIYLALEEIEHSLEQCNLNPASSWSNHFATLFGVYTTLITSFVGTGMLRSFIEHVLIYSIPVALGGPTGGAVAICLALAAGYFGNLGQRQLAMLKNIKNTATTAATRSRNIRPSCPETIINIPPERTTEKTPLIPKRTKSCFQNPATIPGTLYHRPEEQPDTVIDFHLLGGDGATTIPSDLTEAHLMHEPILPSSNDDPGKWFSCSWLS